MGSFAYANTSGRYDPDYYISKKDLKILEASIQKLLALTQELRKKKSFVAQVYTKLKIYTLN